MLLGSPAPALRGGEEHTAHGTSLQRDIPGAQRDPGVLHAVGNTRYYTGNERSILRASHLPPGAQHRHREGEEEARAQTPHPSGSEPRRAHDLRCISFFLHGRGPIYSSQCSNSNAGRMRTPDHNMKTRLRAVVVEVGMEYPRARRRFKGEPALQVIQHAGISPVSRHPRVTRSPLRGGGGGFKSKWGRGGNNVGGVVFSPHASLLGVPEQGT